MANEGDHPSDEESQTPHYRTAEYMRALRATNPELLIRQRAVASARREAIARLIKAHPTEFELLYTQVKKERGL